MKKNIAYILIILAFGIFIFAYKFYFTSPSLSDIQNLVKTRKQSPNMSIVTNFTSYYNNEKSSSYSYISYLKDNVNFITGKSQDGSDYQILSNYNTGSKVSIFPSTKTIISSKVDTQKLDGISISEIDLLLNATASNSYKYIGKTQVNSRKCIEITLTKNIDSSLAEETHFYIDSKNYNILKISSYSNNSLTYDITYSYSYDSVTDTNIIQFNAANYTDYKILNSEK